MASCNLQWRSSTKKDLRSLPQYEVARIVAAVEQLADDPLPHGCQKLAGSERIYRIRVGDYRIIYEAFGSPLTIEISVYDTAKMYIGISCLHP